MADVIAIGSYQADVVACCVVLRLMLLPFFVADVIATAVLADVIARWFDVKSTHRCVCGRCYGHWVNVLILILMLYLRPHPIYEADGTCLCFCLGMGH